MSISTVQLINYINNIFDSENVNIITEEVNGVMNTLYLSDCSKFIATDISYTITGVSENINTPNYSFLIPNLFRKCYLQDILLIPNICPKYISNSINFNFYPILIDENTIKAFLYFNFPVNIKGIGSLKKNINKIINFKKSLIEIKKKNQTYGSYTLAVQIYNSIYGINSMLVQIISFSNFLEGSNYSNYSALNISNFTILWDLTLECINNNSNVENTFITGNFNYNYQLTSNVGLDIYNLKNTIKQISIYSPQYTPFIKNSIFGILTYANDVYEDCILEIQSFMLDREYCRKSYMNEDNIPFLLESYYKFYKNQIETINKQLLASNTSDVVPKTISISNYLSEYYIIYIKTYPTRSLIKNIILDEHSAITVYTNVNNWNNVQIEIDYYYYYININYPSAVQLYNQNVFLPSYNNVYSNLTDFTSVFNLEYSLYINSVNENYLNEYIGSGLYPRGGTIPNPENIGRTYNFINSSNNIYLLYEMLESYAPYNPNNELNGKGVALLYLKE